MNGTKAFVLGVLCLGLASCSTSELAPLALDGEDWHPSLKTRSLDSYPISHVPRAVIEGNPYLSSNPDFVEAIARSGSQGQRGGNGVRSALYALYGTDKDLGIYGLEAASKADADQLEKDLRAVWAHNVSLDRAQVHRGNLVLVVVWHDGVAPDCWEAVNSGLAERLGAS